MLFYMASVKKGEVGSRLSFGIRNKKWFKDHVGYGVGQYAVIVRGFAVIEPEGETPVQFFMSKDTPYIVWREDGGNTSQCFFMKLDHRNPSECEGGDLTVEQAWEAVGNKIREEGSSDLPTDLPNLRLDLNSFIDRELRTRVRQREQRAGTFWGPGATPLA